MHAVEPQFIDVSPDTDDGQAPDALAHGLIQILPTLVRLVVAEMHGSPHAAGMNLAQFRTLGRLRERDYRAAELAAVLEVGRPTLTVTVEHLVRRGLVERSRTIAHDRRGVLLQLTPAGRALYSALEARVVKMLARLLAATSPEERAALALGIAVVKQSLESAGKIVLPIRSEGD
jgi:DNA-binding MarR family transcriptional regulator